MSDDESKAEELLAEAKSKSRHETEPSNQADDETPVLEDAIADAYAELEAGDLHSNLTLRDDNLAALFAGMEATSDLERIGTEAADVLDRDADPSTRADVLRLLVRVGLEEVDGSVLESGKEGRRQFLATDEF
ncbi:hypothetical protein [Natronorubrum texcoconense]|uniref:DUF8115 domain-containing protein n=1 Tax=Natronorubrum texcoconense TaxID=1095776 RepID=A0A1G9H9G8_9EURY|nr:hypothetical protein [Natronorubrum texcoconense]SDL09527.1 hypothetical protein SAMN04515672_0156 [Natronorubrum texcoconense]